MISTTEGRAMSDTPKKPEQQDAEEFAVQFADLPNQPVTEKEADSVKGGFGDIKGESTDKDHKDWIL
jgi:hypothetical protein